MNLRKIFATILWVLVLLVSMAGILWILFGMYSSFTITGTGHHLYPPGLDNMKESSLATLALEKVLGDASPIFGQYRNVQSNTSTWMSRYPDSMKIVHMNIPGTCTYW